MKYTFDSRVRFSEVDEEGYLKFNNFINYFQDCSTFQSEDLGVGVRFLSERNRAWVISMWQIEVMKYPKLGDRISIGTFAYDFKSFMGFRNFYMLDENGDYLAKANSIWVLLNLETGKPEKAPFEEMELYGKEEKLDMDYKPRKIPIPEDLKALDPIEVMPHHIDVNHHVNNGQYLNIAASIAGNKKRPSSLRVEYRNQARLGDMLYPYTNGKVVDLRSESGSSYCTVEIE